MKKIILSLVAVFAFGIASAQDGDFGLKNIYLNKETGQLVSTLETL